MSTEERIRAFIVRELNWDGDPEELTADRSLIDGHVVDSLGIQQLVAFLEDEFRITVDDEEVLPSNFESIRRLTGFVTAKQRR